MNRFLPLLLLGTVVAFGPITWGEEFSMRLRMHDGSFSTGELVPSPEPGRLGWQSEGFASPFQFDLQTLRSVSLVNNPDNEAGLEGIYHFEMTTGALIAGKLLSINEEFVEVDNEILGKLRIDRSKLVSISDASFAGQIVYQGPINADDWQAASDSVWNFQAGALVTKKQGSVIVGDVGLPPKARVDLSLTWEGEPDFVFSFGTSANNQVSRAEQVPAAGRLEVWDKQLALVREVEGGADVALVSDLNAANSRIKLTVLIDQSKGTVTVCDAHGRPLDSVSAIAKREIVRTAVHLVNHGPSLTLESFEVREWDGERHLAPGSEDGSILNADGKELMGTVRGYDPERKVLLIEGREDDVPKEIALSQVRRADFATPKSTETQPSESEPADNPKSEASSTDGAGEANEAADPGNANADDASQGANPPTKAETSVEQSDSPDMSESSQKSVGAVEVILLDRSRFLAKLLPNADHLAFEVDGISSPAEPLHCEPQQIRGLIGTSKRYVPNGGEHRNGTIKLGETQLYGFLLETSPSESDTALFWNPNGSSTAAELLASASGAIIYRKQLPRIDTSNKQERKLIPMINIFLGPAQTPKEVENAEDTAQEPLENAREIMFRTGDSIDGVVDRIDEKGMHFRSNQTSTQFASHDQIQTIWLNKQADGPSFKKEWLERLKTIPRSMKDDPPTHLFVSINGDYLRGRLVDLDAGVATVEIRLEIRKLNVDQISQIVWLHDRKWEEESSDDNPADADPQIAPNNAKPFRVHAIGESDRGLTFIPNTMEQNTLRGSSELLGACSVNLQTVNQLLFGRDIGARVREFNEDPWVLSLAQYPKVYLDSDEVAGDPSSGQLSPLVGKAAPDFGLKTLDGDNFVLNRNRNRVIVLDFWASWCGPCMQTMPLVEEAVNEIGGDDVQLVAVNIQESANRIAPAVDRLGLNEATILLDVDGEVAAAYQANAIPQTVIIDHEGKVTHVFVGGGSRTVASFKAALRQVLGIEESEPAAE